MIGFTRQVEVEIGPAVAFELLANMAGPDRWNPNVASSQMVSGDRFGLGSRYKATIVPGTTSHVRSFGTDGDRARKDVRYEGRIPPFWSVDQLTFELSDRGARITFHNETRSLGILRVFDPILNAVFQGQARRAVEGAVRHVGTP